MRQAEVKPKQINRIRVNGSAIFCALVLAIFPLFTACGIATVAENNRNERNASALRIARENIEQYRKGTAQISVLNARGLPADAVRLQIRQISHDFRFGCYLKIDDLDPEKLAYYSDRFKQLFNYAVIGSYWSNIEHEQGVENWKWFDREAELSEKVGSRISAAPVLWGTNKYGRPPWLPTSKSELGPVLQRWVRSAVERNPKVSDWEIVNEPLSKKKDEFAAVVTDDYIADGFRIARDAAGAKRLMINESGVFGSGSHGYNRTRYLELLRSLLSRGVPIDIIGIQAHAQGEWYSPADVADRLQRYSELGKPIQITEFSVQTHNYNDRTRPLRITDGDDMWTDEKQAEFYREFYTIAFGSPQVEAVITWGLDDERAWLPGIGLLDMNGQPKPAYRELDRLINTAWKTEISGTADKTGGFGLRGFFGDYEIVATPDKGKPRIARFTLRKGEDNDWTIRLDQ